MYVNLTISTASRDEIFLIENANSKCKQSSYISQLQTEQICHSKNNQSCKARHIKLMPVKILNINCSSYKHTDTMKQNFQVTQFDETMISIYNSCYDYWRLSLWSWSH